MTRLTIPILTAVFTALFATVWTTPAAAQSLSDRIADVRKQNARDAAAPTSNEVTLLQALLYTDLSVRYDGDPARLVLDALKTQLGINIIVRYHDDPAGHGIDPQSPITLEVKDMKALDVLQLVLDQCEPAEECTWQLRGSYLEIGTKERLSAPSARLTRTYPIDDLLYEAPRFTDSMQVGMVHPWQEAYRYGGSYRGSYGGGYYRGFGGNRGYGGGLGGSIQVQSTGQTRQNVNNDDAKRRKARDVIELIIDTVEPTAWAMNGGDWASIRYADGALVVTAPDFIQRQINGYGKVPPPKRPGGDAARSRDRR